MEQPSENSRIVFIRGFIQEILYLLFSLYIPLLLIKFLLNPYRYVSILVWSSAVRIVQLGGDSLRPWLPPPVDTIHYLFPNAVPIGIRRNDSLIEMRVIAHPDTPQQSIKHLHVNNNIDNIATRKSLYSNTNVVRFPSLPEGEWNFAEISLVEINKHVDITWLDKSLPGVSVTWHPLKLEYLELQFHPLETTSSEHIKLVSHPSLITLNNRAILKFAEFPDYIPHIEHETRMYKQLIGAGGAPRFLGHVAENGRVIGFLLEYIVDTRRNFQTQTCRKLDGSTNALKFLGNVTTHDGEVVGSQVDCIFEYGLTDAAREACRSSLDRLHDRGLAHQDAQARNCLLREDGTAVWVEFGNARVIERRPYRGGYISEIAPFEDDFSLLGEPFIRFE
jgi:hypothetical protein